MTGKWFKTHSDRSLQTAWNCIQLGALALPLFPNLGAIAIFVAVITTLKHRYQQILNLPKIRGLLGLAGLLLLTVIFAENPVDAILGTANFIPYFIVFAALAIVLENLAQLRWLSWLLILPGIPIVILGLGQQFLGWSGIEILHSVIGWVLAPGGNPPGRMASVFMYANILAAYLVIVFALALGLLVAELGLITDINPDKNRLLNNVNPGFFLVIAATTTIFSGLGLIVTNSRNAWVVAVCISLAYAIYLGWNWLLGLVGVVVAAVLGAAFAPSPIRDGLRVIIPGYFWQRLTDENFDRPLETLRITQWRFTWEMTRQRPITGWGLRNFTPVYEAQMNVWMGHPHSLPLMMMAEVGIPITIAFWAGVGWVLLDGVKLMKAGSLTKGDRLVLFSYIVAFGACVLFNLVDVTIFDFRVNLLGWLLLAGIYGVTKN
ncbi:MULTISPECIES: O-antigen ligase family protein [Arthrospira]|uniref:O-antigen ligase family protein n=1 Tax=Limnospira platensis TaxID=118562 RepID=UPI0007A0E7BD|nr:MULTISPECIES: O-antigen ligase family protein [Arthrospira]AMW27593.1 polymerase [Arthrospira platensis YZ]MBD2709345.1 O-antigen ligase family protein [Arthrospira platensis FACHB-835]MDT9294710.1 O-antigen ligase family protein [Arthrospira platensis PCC 7345]QQW30343.1 O-antigen ligase family protein [Arthrospira sp. PCC 9108]MBD2572397.1 O-antigen ligase family protein [Arthrospira platensis FACHB-971]